MCIVQCPQPQEGHKQCGCVTHQWGVSTGLQFLREVGRLSFSITCFCRNLLNLPETFGHNLSLTSVSTATDGHVSLSSLGRNPLDGCQWTTVFRSFDPFFIRLRSWLDHSDTLACCCCCCFTPFHHSTGCSAWSWTSPSSLGSFASSNRFSFSARPVGSHPSSQQSQTFFQILKKRRTPVDWIPPPEAASVNQHNPLAQLQTFL